MQRFYEVQVVSSYVVVKAESMQQCNDLCIEKGFRDWRVCGMMSRTQMIQHKANAPLLSEM
jgi:hypothetical protein